jgi:hypothetical protein
MGRPVFVFPAWDNVPTAIAIETRVAAHVGRDRPFWAFRRDESHLDCMRAHGVPALATRFVTQIQVIQGKGPFLLYGNCAGGYLAWETARQLLELGEQISGVFFFEVPIRPDFTRMLPGHPPVHSENLWRITYHYRLQSLPIDLTCLMTESWRARGWWAPWQEVALGTVETVVIPAHTMSKQVFLARREAIIARHVRDWIDKSEARLQSADAAGTGTKSG